MKILKKKKTLRKKNLKFQLKKNKEVGNLSMRLFLLLSEAQSSGFVRVCKQVEMSARWRNVLPIKVKRALYFHICFAS